MIPASLPRCADCASRKVERNRESDRRYNSKRDPKYLKFYRSKEWKSLSKGKLADAGYRCEECGAVAVDVHHEVPIRTDEGWGRRFDWNCLKALCVRCHNKAHGRF